MAQTNTNSYTGLSGGSWTTAGNWSLGVAPNTNLAVVISNGVTVQSLGSSAAAYSVVVGGASGTSVLSFNTAGNALAVGKDLTLAPGAGVGHLLFVNTNTSLTLNGGSGRILRGAGSGEARLEFRGGFSGSLGLSSATVDNLLLAGTTTGTLSITNGQTYNVSEEARVTTANSAGASGVLNVAGGVLNMGDASTFGTSSGYLKLNTGTNTGNTATVNLSGGGSIVAKAIRRENAGAGAAINWADGTIGTRSDADLTLSALAGAGTLDIFLAGTGAHAFNAQSGRTITVASTAVLRDKVSEAGTLTKTGAGTLVLSGSNSYTGGTTVNGGTVLMDNNAALGSGTVTMNAGTTLSTANNTSRTLGNNLVVGGDVSFNQTSGGTGTLSLGGASIDLGGTNRRLTINTSGLTIVTETNSLATTAGFTKAGEGRLNISQTQNYSGSTILEAGTLSAGGNAAFGSSTLVLRGGTLASSSSAARTWNNAVNIEGDVVLTEAVDRTGAITLSGAVGLGNANRTLTVNTAATLSAAVGGTGGGLTKEGAGTLTLSGTNTYTGTTTVSAGTLLVSKASLTATILSNSVKVTFTNSPANGTYPVLPGPVGSASFASNSVTGFGVGKTAIMTNSPNLSVVVSDSASGTIPSAPTINSINPGNGSLSVAFTAGSDGGSAITNYKYSTDGGSTFTAVSPAATTSPISITGLINGTAYNVQIRAVNANGDGTATSSTSATPQAPGPTFESSYTNGLTEIAPNGLSYLVNYAFGGTKTNEAKLPSQDFSDPTKLTLVAYVRTNNTGGTLQVKGEKGSSLTSFDTNNPVDGVPAGDNIGAPVGTQKQIFSVTNSGDRLFLRLRVTK